MKPVLLKMSAFGPYAGVETIDYKELKDKNIFLITGPTGAGKTTIFDAISYALFGEASGESRDNDGLRSGFASDEVPTFVELEFELRGENYKITRYPAQFKKKERGEGLAFKPTDAELLLPGDRVITKVSNVDEKINELLGINKQQFRQIVMLAQGEFRKLLEADSQDRERIFRKIFSTEGFEVIQRRLNDQKSQLSRRIAEKATERTTFVKQLEANDEELLRLKSSDNLNVIEIMEKTAAYIEREEAESSRLKVELELLKRGMEKLQKSIIEGTEINKKIKQELSLKNEYNIMKSREEEFGKKSIKLELGRKALVVKGQEENFLSRKKALENKERELKAAEEALKLAETRVATAKAILEGQEKREPLGKELLNKITTVKNYEPKVRGYEEKVANIVILKAELKKREEQRTALKKFIQEGKLALEKANAELLDIQNSETIKEKLQKQIGDLKSILQETTEFLTHYDTYNKNKKEHSDKSIEFNIIDGRYKEEKIKYEHMDDTFRRDQAGLLARELKKDMPCPVCGSTDHPSPAKLLKEGDTPTKEELKEQKKIYDNISEQRINKLNELSTLEGSKKEQSRILGEKAIKLKSMIGEEVTALKGMELLAFITNKNTEIKAQLKGYEAELAGHMKKIEGKPSLTLALEKLNNEIISNEKKIEIIEDEYTEAFGRVKTEEEAILGIEKDIPGEMRTLDSLNAAISALRRQYDEIEGALKAAQNNYNEAVVKFREGSVDKELKEKDLGEVRQEVEELREKLNKRIIESGFEGYNHYFSSIMTEEMIQLLNREITDYNNNLKSIKSMHEQAVKSIEGLTEVDLESLNSELSNLNLRQDEIAKKEKETYSRIRNNKRALMEIKRVNELISEDEDVYSIVADIAKMANGDNYERISFERYVLAAYFDEIIAATNTRLFRMTGGRFALTRIKQKGKGRKQEGLELEVFDNYTGKARHVTTLSGGESFKASLAMALGLADVVQEYAGGISLDTIFIDEGFGTLDPESLDNAIECLFDLQKGGRLVGVISHVTELKERIGARLEVTPAKEGSQVKIVC